MAGLVDYLQLILNVPIADCTGLHGEYEVAFKVEPAEDPNDLDRLARFAAALRGIGLDLKKGTVPVNAVIVDSVSKTPTPN